MHLYTVHFDRLTLISLFDDSGFKTGDYEDRVRVSLHDLPASTVAMYRERMSDLNFVAELQVPGNERPTVRHTDRARRARDHRAKAPAPVQAGPTALQIAAQTGDMAAAINKR